jgi:hypothetical protein
MAESLLAVYGEVLHKIGRMQTFGKLSPKAQPEHRYSQLPSTRSVKRNIVLYIIHSALTPGINFLCTLEYMEI